MKKLACLAAIAVAPFSMAITFDWETLSASNFASVSQTVGGVTATATGTGGRVDVHSLGGPYGTRSVVGSTSSSYLLGPWSPTRIDFSVLVSSVTVGFGDLGGDDDGTVTVRAFKSDNTLVDVDSLFVGTSGTINFLTLTGADIAYIVGESPGTTFPHTVVYDEITIEPQSVPEPFTMALMGGAAVAGFRRMRRQKA